MLLRICFVFLLLLSAQQILFCSANSAAFASEHGLHMDETDDAITVKRQGRTVLVYNKTSPPVPEGIDPVYRRSGFLHPVFSPAGKVVTGVFPADHPHQQGIFSAWVKTRWRDREIDFWNLAGQTGRVIHHRVLSKFNNDRGAGFEVELIHRAVEAPVTDVLLETWKVTVLASKDGVHCFELESSQRNLTDSPLTVLQHHYGGFAVRGPIRWLEPDDKQWTANLGPVSGSHMRNDLGSDRESGNLQRARWVSMFPRDTDQLASITMLGVTTNQHAPQAARLHPTKPYFCFAACVDGDFAIDKDHSFGSRYRFVITDQRPDPSLLNEHYQDSIER